MTKTNKHFIGVYVLLILIVTATMGCKLKTAESPEINSLSPQWTLSNLPFSLTVNGSGFTGTSTIVFNYIQMPTHFVNSNQLSCTIEAVFTALNPANDLNINPRAPVYVIDGKKSNIQYLSIKHQPEFSDPVLIYNGATDGFHHARDETIRLVVNEKPRFYLIWQEEKEPWDSPQPYMMSISIDSGQTWSEAVEIPAIRSFFARNGTLYAWGISDKNIITLYRSGDSGESWSSSVVALPDENKSHNNFRVAIDENDTFFLVYGETENYQEMTLFTLQSPDYGDTWEKKGEYVMNTMHEQYFINWMVVNNNRGLCLGYTYFYGRYGGQGSLISTDGGMTFDLSNGFDSYRKGFLTDQGELYVLYHWMPIPYSYHPAFFKGSELGDVTLKTHQFIGTSFVWVGDMIKDAEGNLYIVWENKMTRSIDDGDTWTDEVEFNDAYAYVKQPSVVMDKDSIFYLVWNGQNEIYLSTIVTRQ